MPRRLRTRCAGALLTAFGLAAAVAVPAWAAPLPSPTAASPTAPNPHPPAGMQAPDGSVPGGVHLASRGTIRPVGAPPLPTGIGAKGWVLVDLDSGAVLAARDPHGRYQPASILKMLTAITVLPNLPGSKQVTVSRTAAQAEGSAVGLLAGAKYSVDDLFAALMLVSGNDAAAALAQANGGVAATVAQMNAKARSLGAYDTVVQTPSGLDGFRQLTSAYDMALVLRATIHQPRLLHYDGLSSQSFAPRKSAYGQVGGYEFDNQSNNFFATVPGGLVAKIGYTDAARHTYLAAARRGGRTLGVVFLRDERLPLDQYQQAGALFDWGFALRSTVKPIGMLAGPISATKARASTAAPVARSAVPGTSAASVADGAAVSRRRANYPVADITVAAVIALLGFAVTTLVRRRRVRPRR